MFPRPFSRVLIVASLLASAASAARADLVTVDFTGTVATLPDPTGIFAGAAVGDTFTGSLVYDSAASPVTPGANPAQYLYSAASTPPYLAPLGISVTLRGVTVSPRYPGAMILTVSNDLATNPAFPDVFIAQAAAGPLSGATNPQIDFAVADSTGTALGSTALPTSLDLSRFTDSQFRLFNNKAGSVFDIFTGTLDLRPVPEPGSLALMAVGAAGLAVGAARRKSRGTGA